MTAVPRAARRPTVVLVLALLASILVPLGAAPGPAGASTTTTVALTTVRSIAPVGDGRLLVAGDDEVQIYSPTGVLVGIVPDVFGAADIDVRDGHAFVVQTTAGAVADIDLTTYATTNIAIGTVVKAGGIAVLPDAIWFLDSLGRSSRYDRSTGALTTPAGVTSGATRLVRIPGDDSRVVASLTGSSSGWLQRVSATAPHAVSSIALSFPRDVAPTDRGTVFVANDVGVREIDLDDWSWVGAAKPSASGSVEHIAWTPEFGGAVGWTSGSRNAHAADDGSTALSSVFSWANALCLEGVSFVPGSSSLAVLERTGASCNTALVLRLYDLTPEIATITPGSAVEGVPTTVTATGNGLGQLTGVTIGGLPVAVVSQAPNQLVVDVPTTLPAGSHDLVVTSAFGSTARTISVAPVTGALLQGTVRRGSSTVASASVTLDGGTLGAPIATTTAANGQFSIPSLPYGTDYVVTVTDPAGTQAPQVIGPLVLRPNDPTTLAVSLVERPSSGAVTSTASLPSGTRREVVLDPVSGRSYLAVGDEVIEVDASGAILVRRLGLTGVSALAVGTGALYALLPGSSQVVELDPLTLASVDSWTLPATPAPTLAVADGRVWTSSAASPYPLIALDPATGALSTHTIPGGASTYARLRNVVGDDNLLLGNHGTTSGVLRVYDVSSGTPTVAASRSSTTLPAAGDATHNRVWLPTGDELRLSDLTVTGISYPATDGQSTYTGSGVGVVSSAGLGGVVVFGRNSALRGVPRNVHQLPVTPEVQPALDPLATRVVAITTSATVATVSLTPQLTGPTSTFAEPQTLTLTGYGLGAVSSARVDGASVSVGQKTSTSVQLLLAALSPGSHAVDVTTPWGTSTALTVGAITRTPTPVVTSAAPSTLPTAGGSITITGSGFTGATAVKVGTAAAASFTVVDDTTITAEFGPRTVSSGGLLSVTTPGGGTNTSGPTFNFFAPQPVVSGLSPAQGTPAGGTVVTVTGSGFQFATGVKFGTANGTSISVVSDVELRVTSPASSLSSVAVTVTTAGGTSAASPAATFAYVQPAPTVTGVSPSSGPSAGGTLVTITGTTFSSVQRVQFGEVNASFTVIDATRIVAISPPGTGVQNVRVTTIAGSSLPTVSNRFSYAPPNPGSVRGHVRSSAAPLGGMAVVLSPSDRFEVLTYVMSQPDGSFEITGQWPGEYRVLTIDPSSLAGATEYYLAELYDEAGTLLDDVAAATPVVVSAGQATVLDPIVLAHSQPATINGVVRDTVGHELAGMEVVVSPASGLDTSVSVVTGPDGRFSATGLAPGDYRVVTIDPATATGATAHYVTEVYDDAGGLSNFAGSAVVSLDRNEVVELDPIELAHTSPGSIQATTTSAATGIPLQHMVVLVTNADEFVFAGANVTAANGTITIGNLPPGDYKVGIFDARVIFGVPPTYRDELYEDATSFADATRVVVAAGATTTLNPIRLDLFVP